MSDCAPKFAFVVHTDDSEHNLIRFNTSVRLNNEGHQGKRGREKGENSAGIGRMRGVNPLVPKADTLLDYLYSPSCTKEREAADNH